VRESVLLHAAAIAVVVLAHSSAFAQSAPPDMLKVSVGGRGAFDHQVAEVGREQGIFKTHGLDLELSYGQGGGETLTAVMSGAADVGMSVGTLEAIGAFAKGAPVRVIGSAMIGATELWYVRANSPIKSLKEAAGRTIAYSATGSASNLMVLGLQELYGIKVKPVATGDLAATLTQVMGGQVDIGYSVPPFGVAELEQGKIRIVGRANDMPALARQTVRVIVANADALEKRPDALRRFMQGYRETSTGCSRPIRSRSPPMPNGRASGERRAPHPRRLHAQRERAARPDCRARHHHGRCGDLQAGQRAAHRRAGQDADPAAAADQVSDVVTCVAHSFKKVHFRSTS